MEKQKMLYQQARLHDRGAAEMVLQMISASKGSKPHTHTHTQTCVLSYSSPIMYPFRSAWCHCHFHPQTGHLHSQRWKHPGPASM